MLKLVALSLLVLLNFTIPAQAGTIVETVVVNCDTASNMKEYLAFNQVLTGVAAVEEVNALRKDGRIVCRIEHLRFMKGDVVAYVPMPLGICRVMKVQVYARFLAWYGLRYTWPSQPSIRYIAILVHTRIA